MRRASISRTARRQGSALLVAVAALLIVAVATASVARQCVVGRRLVERRQQHLQAEWLARAGVELAADRLLADPTTYRGETLELIPGGRVRVEVRADPKAADVFRVSSEARYPDDEADGTRCSATRSFRRTRRDGQVRLEVIAESR